MVEAWDEEHEGEHVLEENEASEDELEAEYKEAMAMMIIAKQRRAEVDRARQFFGNPSHVKIARPSSTSSSRNFHGRDVGNWAIGMCYNRNRGRDQGGLLPQVSRRALHGQLCLGTPTLWTCRRSFLGESNESLFAHLRG